MSDLGSRLKLAREKKHLTQKEVADKLGVSNGAISGYERNYRDPDTDMLKKLATLYDVSVDFLAGHVITEKKATYEINKEELIREQKLLLADEILSLPEPQRTLVMDMVKALREKNK